MNFDGQRLRINGDPLVQQEANPVVYPRYVLKCIYFPRNVWTGLEKNEPTNIRPINVDHLGPDSIFTTPSNHTSLSVYDNGSLTELFGIIERERIFELGLSALEGLVVKSERIIPRLEIKVGCLFHTKEMIPEDVIAEFLKRPEEVDVNLLGRGYKGDRLIMTYRLGSSSQISEQPENTI